MPSYRVSISTAPSTSTTTTSISTSEFSQPESAARQRPQSSFVGIPIAVHTPDSTHLPVADQQHAELRLLAEASVPHIQADPFEALAAHRTVTFAHSDDYQEQSDDSSLLSNEPSQPVEGSDHIVKEKPCEVALSVSLPTNGRETNTRTTTSISEQEILPSINDHFRRALSKTVPEALLTAITGVRQFPIRQSIAIQNTKPTDWRVTLTGDPKNQTSTGQAQYSSEIEQVPPASLAGMDSRTQPSEEAFIPVLPPTYQQIPGSRQLSTQNVSVLSSHQLIHFQERSSADPYVNSELLMNDIDDVMKDRLKEDYVPVKSGRDMPGPIRNVSKRFPKWRLHSLVNEHFQRALSETGGISQPLGVSTTNPQEMVHSSADDPCASNQVIDPTDDWIIITDSKEKPFKCGYQQCNKSYKKKVHLKAHFLKHTHVSNFKCTYPECIDRYFPDLAALKRHIRSIHTFERPYQCEICDWRFGRKDHMKAHKKNVHSPEKEKKSWKRKRK